jgi:hypothetical protein
MGDCGGGCPACVDNLTARSEEVDEGEGDGDEGDEGDDTECKCSNCARDELEDCWRSPNHVMSHFCSDCGDYVQDPELTRVARHPIWQIHRQICDDCHATYETNQEDRFTHYWDDSMCGCVNCDPEAEEDLQAEMRADAEDDNTATSTSDDHMI